ncbi:MAG: trimeric intracellular cation channel family protein [Helicobacter sp.]|nr:trimeric intracellular cation channel family protein [Helicobacter sp.]
MQSVFLETLLLVGIIAEAMSGGLLAGKRKMDFIGVIFIGVITAIGGGSIRDVLFNHHPLLWIKHPEYIIILCAFALLAITIPKMMAKLEKTFLILDAIGLVVFSITGTIVAVLDLKMGLILGIVSGVITGVFGGILRDILCNEIPLVFHKEIYVSVSILSSALFYALFVHFGLSLLIASIITLIVGVTLRVLVIYFKLRFPNIDFDKH